MSTKHDLLVNTALDIIYKDADCMCNHLVKMTSLPLLPNEKAEEYVRQIGTLVEALLEDIQQSIGYQPTPDDVRVEQREHAISEMLKNLKNCRDRMDEIVVEW